MCDLEYRRVESLDRADRVRAKGVMASPGVMQARYPRVPRALRLVLAS